MKKNFFLLIILLMFLFFPNDAFAVSDTICNTLSSENDCNSMSRTCEWSKDDSGNSGYCTPKTINKSICDTMNNSKTTCESYNSCRWVVEGENGGFCTLKTTLTECSQLSPTEKEQVGYCVQTCSYEYTVGSNLTDEFYTKCSMWITLDNENNPIIQWYYNNKSFGTLGKQFSNISCAKAFNLYNTNLGNQEDKMEAFSPDGTIGAPDFKKRWSNYYRKTGKCPRVDFEYYMGNYFVYFTDSDDPIWNTGGTTDSNGNSNNNSSNNNQNDNKISVDNQNAEILENILNSKVTCGGIKNFTFPSLITKITSTVYNLLKIAIPVLLVIKGMLDMFKATSAQKEDEMKKAQKKFVQRLITGISALLVFIIVETVINFIADKTGNSNAMDCVNCFINNECTTVGNTSNNTTANNTTNNSNTNSSNNSNNSTNDSNQYESDKFYIPFPTGTNYKVSSDYGERVRNGVTETHNGIDLVATEGTKVVASADGTVVQAGNRPRDYGYYVKIKHANGVYSMYMHMKAESLAVQVGDSVSAKQVLGEIGTTGNSSDIHLDFRFSYQEGFGTKVNPRNFVTFVSEGSYGTAD